MQNKNQNTNKDYYIIIIINILSEINNHLSSIINIYSTCKDFYNIKTKYWNLTKILSDEFIKQELLRKTFYTKIINQSEQLSINYIDKHIECKNEDYIYCLKKRLNDIELFNINDFFKYIKEYYFLNNYICIDFDLHSLKLIYTYCDINNIIITNCIIYYSYIFMLKIKSNINKLILSNCIIFHQNIIISDIINCYIDNTNITKFKANNSSYNHFSSCNYLESIDISNAISINITNCQNIKEINIPNDIESITLRTTFYIFELNIININHYTKLLYLKIENDYYIENINIPSLNKCLLYNCSKVCSLHGCDNLKYLDIRENIKLKYINNLNKLITLFLINTDVNDIFINSLKTIHIENCDFIQQINSKNVKNLESLTIDKVKNISKITGNKLNFLKIIGNIKCTKLNFINLNSLILINTNVKNIYMPKLKTCVLDNTPILSINNNNITKLYIRNSNIEKIYCKNIEKLYLYCCNNIINIKFNKLLKLCFIKCNNVRFIDCEILEILKIERDNIINNNNILINSNIPNVKKILYI